VPTIKKDKRFALKHLSLLTIHAQTITIVRDDDDGDVADGRDGDAMRQHLHCLQL